MAPLPLSLPLLNSNGASKIRAPARTQARRIEKRRSLEDWPLPITLNRVRQRLTHHANGDHQMVGIPVAAMTDGLYAVEATCAKALAGGNVSRDVVFNVLNADEQVHFALTGLDLGNVVVKQADWVALEALPPRLVTVDIGQAGDAMPLATMVQC